MVPVPAIYIDYVMPALTDVEWRVLLVVIRQTIGWVFEEGGSPARKERDWLSHSQLKARTGKGGDAISRSIDSLVRYGLIVVEREDGRVVTNAQERRRVRHRLYYRLGQLPYPTGEGEQ
ncbi:replication protein [Armatimonas rosea]|uniref:Uncharacterized protein n=1 Tax=Armatimonas rosea TaxID=685828 RepID=A0A7W9SXX0_ARMRO|nr:replication protein [Armatimonas rosea]MBB6053938.1 hypothetical protein [Armatimonas rosea]